MRCIGLAALLVGCAARPAAAPPPLGPPGTVTISVERALAWPYRPARTLVALDGAVISAGAIQVVAGPHTVSVMTDVTLQCSVFSSQQATIRVRTSQSFVVGEAPVAARLRIWADADASRGYDERLHARWAIVGAPSEPVEPLPAACAGLDAPQRARCRVADLMERARKARDVVAVHCYRDKLERIEKLLPAASVGGAVAIENIAKLEQEALQCVGDEGCYFGPSIEMSDTCGAELPEASSGAPEPPIPLLIPASPVPPVK